MELCTDIDRLQRMSVMFREQKEEIECIIRDLEKQIERVLGNVSQNYSEYQVQAAVYEAKRCLADVKRQKDRVCENLEQSERSLKQAVQMYRQSEQEVMQVIQPTTELGWMKSFVDQGVKTFMQLQFGSSQSDSRFGSNLKSSLRFGLDTVIPKELQAASDGLINQVDKILTEQFSRFIEQASLPLEVQLGIKANNGGEDFQAVLFSAIDWLKGLGLGLLQLTFMGYKELKSIATFDTADDDDVARLLCEGILGIVSSMAKTAIDYVDPTVEDPDKVAARIAGVSNGQGIINYMLLKYLKFNQKHEYESLKAQGYSEKYAMEKAATSCVLDLLTVLIPASKLGETGRIGSKIEKVDELGSLNKLDELGDVERVAVEGKGTLFEGAGKVVFETTDEYFGAITKIGKRADLTKTQKLEQILEAYKGLKNKGDVTVVSDVRFLTEQGFDLNTGRMLVEWPPKMGFAEDSIKSITRNNPLPDKWDRVGSISGENFTVIPNNRPAYSYTERAIPYVQNTSAHHIGTFNNSAYYDVIDSVKSNDIANINKTMSKLGNKELAQPEFDIIRDQYSEFQKRVKNEIGNINADYGLNGHAAAWKNTNGEVLLSGGAEQIVTPLKGNILKRLGLIND